MEEEGNGHKKVVGLTGANCPRGKFSG